MYQQLLCANNAVMGFLDGWPATDSALNETSHHSVGFHEVVVACKHVEVANRHTAPLTADLLDCCLELSEVPNNVKVLKVVEVESPASFRELPYCLGLENAIA